jgi:D-3-phosphoglycerate dehydrogenase
MWRRFGLAICIGVFCPCVDHDSPFAQSAIDNRSSWEAEAIVFDAAMALVAVVAEPLRTTPWRCSWLRAGSTSRPAAPAAPASAAAALFQSFKPARVAPAELTWALIMASMRRLPQYIGNLKHGVWQQSGLKAASMPPNFGVGMLLKGKTLGIWGYGKIGRLVAGYGRAFGMDVMVWGSVLSRERAVADGCTAAPSCEHFFEHADVLSLHLRLSDQTRGIVRLDALSRMKPTALLVNTSRAELLEEHALVAALNRGRPGLAAVDVFESEPILQGHPLLRLENAVCTPHIGYVEQDSYELYFGAAFDNVINFIHNTPTNLLNPEALKVLR